MTPGEVPNAETTPSDVSRASALVAATLVCAAGLASFVKVMDPDVWWHVRVGQWMWEAKALPASDPFSFAANPTYGSHPWFAELLFYGAHALGGPHGILLLNAILVATLTALVLRFATPSPLDGASVAVDGRPVGAPVAVDGPPIVERGHAGSLLAVTLTTLLWLVTARFRLSTRPELFSHIGLVLVLLTLRSVQRTGSPRALAWLPLVFLFWANVHRGALSALVFLGLTAGVWFLNRGTRRNALYVLLTTVGAALALLVNPFGIEYFASTLRVMTVSAYTENITEWHPMHRGFLMSAGAPFVVFTLLWMAGNVRKRRPAFELVIVLFAMLAAARSVRLVALPAIAMIPGVSACVHDLVAWLARRVTFRVRKSVQTLALSLGTLAAVGVDYVLRWPTGAWGSGTASWRLPVAAVEFLKKNPPPADRMWNNFVLGGYLLFGLGPEIKVLMDGRNDIVYSPALFLENVEATTKPEVLRAQLDRFELDLVVAPTPGLVETRYLGVLAAPDFEPVYMDDLVTILLRKSEHTLRYREAHGYKFLRPHTMVERARRLEGERDPASFVTEIERNVRESPESFRALYAYALIAQRLGRTADFESARDRSLALARERNVVLKSKDEPDP